MKWKIIIIIGVLVLIVGLIGGFIMYLYKPELLRSIPVLSDFLPTRIETQTTYLYNYTDSTNNKAFAGSANNADKLGGTELTAGQYTNIQKRDAVYASIISGGTNHEPFMRFNFTINESKANINYAFVEFTGFENASVEAGVFYVFNQSSSSWLSLAVLPTTNGNITRNFTGVNITDFIGTSNKQLVIAIEGTNFDSGDADYVITDFAQVQINANPPPADTCTYSSGNWAINCADNCNITSNQNLGGNNVTLNGNGLITITANISNYKVVRSSESCLIRTANGGGFKA